MSQGFQAFIIIKSEHLQFGKKIIWNYDAQYSILIAINLVTYSDFEYYIRMQLMNDKDVANNLNNAEK